MDYAGGNRSFLAYLRAMPQARILGFLGAALASPWVSWPTVSPGLRRTSLSGPLIKDSLAERAQTQLSVQIGPTSSMCPRGRGHNSTSRL